MITCVCRKTQDWDFKDFGIEVFFLKIQRSGDLILRKVGSIRRDDPFCLVIVPSDNDRDDSSRVE